MSKYDLEVLLQEVQDAVERFENTPGLGMTCRGCGTRKPYRVLTLSREHYGPDNERLCVNWWGGPTPGWVSISSNGEQPSYAFCPTCATRKQL
jgi:hypothetical protein